MKMTYQLLSSKYDTLENKPLKILKKKIPTYKKTILQKTTTF